VRQPAALTSVCLTNGDVHRRDLCQEPLWCSAARQRGVPFPAPVGPQTPEIVPVLVLEGLHIVGALKTPRVGPYEFTSKLEIL